MLFILFGYTLDLFQFSILKHHPPFSIMPFTLTTFKTKLSSVFKQINKDQAEALSIQISANFIAGQHAAEKHRSFKSAEPEEDEDSLTNTEKAEIAALIALYLGYSKGFNKIAEKQISTTVSEMVTAGKTQDEIRAFVGSVFSGKEKIVIDNIGKIRKEIRVDKNLHITQVEKVVKQKYYSSLNNYADLLGDQAAHDAYESGRKTANISEGYSDWIFTGPADERARPHHVALIGETFTYNTDQSAYAESCLSEPRCRHRAMAFYGDDRDTKKEVWDKLKDDAGLYWDEEKGEWSIH
jgi:hypothetical protein